MVCGSNASFSVVVTLAKTGQTATVTEGHTTDPSEERSIASVSLFDFSTLSDDDVSSHSATRRILKIPAECMNQGSA